jgi:hydroxymethylpyrimidine pyrophosphatase-like HAD family hydrolase
MVLPVGVDKASGLDAALEEMKLSWKNVAGIGDAENDITFLSKCACSVAVSNALDSVKARVDFTTSAPRGEGVVELINEILKDDLQSRLLMQREGPMATTFSNTRS